LNNSLSYTIDQQSAIYLNNTPNFNSEYTWSTATNYVNNQTLNFKFVFLHEMGHLLGLGHRQNVYDNGVLEYAVMNENPDLSHPLFSLAQYDKQGIYDLCQFIHNPTPVEDAINITEYLDHYDINTIYAGDIHADFWDNDGDGNYLTSINWQITSSSSCNTITLYNGSTPDFSLPSLSAGYNWPRDANGYVIGTLTASGTDNLGKYYTSSVPIKIGGVPNTFATSGTLSNDTYYCGNVALTGTVTVPSGVTLTISPGAFVTFPSGALLIVNGVLNASGCTFTSQSGSSPGSWGTITLNGYGSQGSVIQNAVIQYGGGVQFTNDADAEIENSVISNCTNGVYIYNSEPLISGKQITDPQQNGVYIDAESYCPDIAGNLIKSTTGSSSVGIDVADYSLPYITNNRIGGFNYGIYGGGSSISLFMDSGYNTPAQNNLICNNLNGVTAAWGAEIDGGYYSNGGGNNSIHDNSDLDAYAYSSGTLIAWCDFWGTSPKIYWDGSSTFSDDYALGNDPWGGIRPLIQQKPGLKNGDLVESLPTQNSGTADSSSNGLFVGFSFEKKGDINGAIDQYKKLIAADSNTNLAIEELFKLFRKYSRNDVLTYFGNFSSSNKHYPIVSALLANNNLHAGQFNKAIDTYNNLIETHAGDYYEVNARFQKLFAYKNIKNDNITAQEMLSQINSLGLTDPFWLSKIQIADYLLEDNSKSMVKKSVTSLDENILPKEYALSQNYPNPFNPTTVIQYDIPKDGFVTLKIYDILGREVKTLVNENKLQGRYYISFDASKLASGVYIYRLQAGNYIATKKLLLLK